MRKTRIALIILLLLLLVVGVGAYAYWYRPQAVVQRAIAQLGKTNTAHYQAKVTFESSPAAGQGQTDNGSVEVDLDGAYERAVQGKDSITANAQLLSKAEGIAVTTEGEARLIGDKVYFLIKTTPSTLPALVALRGQWIELPRNDGAGSDEAKSLPITFANVSWPKREKIDSAGVSVYQANAAPDTIIRLMDELAGVLGTSLTSEQINSLRQSISQMKEIPVSIAVTPWRNELKQIKIALPGTSTSSVQAILTFKDRNKPVSIEKPEKAMTLEQLRASMQSPSPTPSPAPQQ